MPSLRTCERCKYFTEVSGPRGGAALGVCKRFPPVLNPKFVMDSHSPNAVFKPDAWCLPRVQATDTCGEFQTRSQSTIVTPRAH